MASRAHGIVTRERLLEAGVTAKQVRHRLGSGALLREYPGVYRVGHRAPSLEARYMAAVLACGEAALLSGLAAAYLWALTKGSAPPPEVTAPKKRRLPGASTRRSTPSLAAVDATRCRGIPITTVPRTLVDLAAVLTEEALARACHEAGVRYGISPAQVEAVLARRPRSPGATNLRRVMRGDVRVTLSKLERRFLRLLGQAGLPLPRTNKPAGARRVDCRWPEHRLTVELDSYTYHHSRHAWEQDRRREREAHARGDDLRRYTHDDVYQNPRPILAELAVLLTQAAAPPPPTRT